MSVVDKAKAVGLTVTGAAVGAVVAGPVGALGGAAIGGVIDYMRSRKAQNPGGGLSFMPLGRSSTTVLPPGADVQAAVNTTHLMLLGNQAEAAPASFWLKKFQASVGLPATGNMDANTRTLLVAATTGTNYQAANLSPVTILG